MIKKAPKPTLQWESLVTKLGQKSNWFVVALVRFVQQ